MLERQTFLSDLNPALAASIIAFIGVIVSAMISFQISRRSSYVVAVTAERSKWIDKLRNNIAELLGVCGAIILASSDTKEDEARGCRENADRLIALITMQLNPGNEIDLNMIGLLKLFPKRLESKGQNYRELEVALVRHAQFLLKEEWEKVKFEAMGWMSKPKWYKASKKRKKEYCEFCKRSEALVDRVSKGNVGQI